MTRAIVTTSWDDGHKLDLRLSELLQKYNMPATFYIAPRNREIEKANVLTDQQVVKLSAAFEIGSHTMTHPSLNLLTPGEVTREVVESKDFLQNLTGQTVSSFCYPRGLYNDGVVAAVKDAGYTYARTVERFKIDPAFDHFEAPTALEAHRGPLPYVLHDFVTLAKLNHFKIAKTLGCYDWEVLAKLLFDQAVATGGVYHFWGHSWVVEQFKDWQRLENVLAYISSHKDVDYLTNGQLAERAS